MSVKAATPLTQDRLKELLHYDPDTGIFTWIGTRARRIKNGDDAGTIREVRPGLFYRFINVDYLPRPVHALAWLYVHGIYPKQVDHRDLDGLNNRLVNLRPCTDAQNRANTKRSKRNKSGFKGVSWSSHAGKWRAGIQFSGRQIFLGYFDQPEAAHAEYAIKARELYGEFARAA